MRSKEGVEDYYPALITGSKASTRMVVTPKRAPVRMYNSSTSKQASNEAKSAEDDRPGDCTAYVYDSGGRRASVNKVGKGSYAFPG